MNEVYSEITDMVFELHGESLPASYPFALWEELVRCVPQLAQSGHVSVLPLRVAENNQLMLLSRRTKLVLRLPENMVSVATLLAGSQLHVSENSLSVGRAKIRAIQPYPTLHAQLAAGADDEMEFLDAVQAYFTALKISASTICGIRRTLTDGRQSLSGYSLVVHNLKPEASVRLQCAGMGEGKRFGCGIFMPYKVISDLE